ncbi:qutD Probable quinate permease [Candida maltosa Xu316]
MFGQDKSKEIHSVVSIQDKYNSSSQVSMQEQKKVAKKKFKWSIDTSDHPPEVNFNIIIWICSNYFSERKASVTTLPSFQKTFGLNDKSKTVDQIANIKSNITSFVLLGSIGGAAIAMKSVDFLGRIRALQVVCIILLVGVIIQMTSTSIGQLYAGKIIEGLAVGQTTSIGPVYLSEVAPSPIRGLATCIFAGAVYFGTMLSYFVCYGVALHVPAQINGHINNRQWIYAYIPKVLMAGIIFILSFFLCVESPRWLLKKEKPDQAATNLSKIRHLPPDHPYILAEISDINEQIITERESVKNSSMISNLKALVTNKSVAYRFFIISCGAQLLGQWSGSSAVTIYASELFSIVGVTGVDTLKMSAVLGVVKFVSAYLAAFFIIDVLGRKKSLYTGLTMQLLCILYYAIFLTIVPEAANNGVELTGSKKRASQGALAAIFLSGASWTIGFNSIQYLIGAEIFPLGIRNFAQSLVMVLHFANQFGNTKALPKMMIAMKPYGAFYFFVGVMAIGLVYSFFLPELKGRSLESIEEIFDKLPWYQLRNCEKLVPDHSQVHKIRYTSSEKGNTDFNHIQYDLDSGKPTDEFIENLMDSDDKSKEEVGNKV